MSLFITLQKLLPHHALSRLVGKLAAARTPWLKNLLIRRFTRAFGVDLSEAVCESPDDYACFNDFFTRPLKPGARPLAASELAVLCPADGVISAIGSIDDDTLVQAKGRTYTVTALLGGDPSRSAQFRNGTFTTVYLSPKDYHRVHSPLAGTLREMIYVPGALWSVNQTTADNIDELFAVNERAVCIIDTEYGPMAVVLVGAMIVAAIETVWAGRVAPAEGGLRVYDYRDQTPPILLRKGGELGRFLLGSTAIVLFGPGMVEWTLDLQNGPGVRMGQALGRLLGGGRLQLAD